MKSGLEYRAHPSDIMPLNVTNHLKQACHRGHVVLFFNQWQLYEFSQLAPPSKRVQAPWGPSTELHLINIASSRRELITQWKERRRRCDAPVNSHSNEARDSTWPDDRRMRGSGDRCALAFAREYRRPSRKVATPVYVGNRFSYHLWWFRPIAPADIQPLIYTGFKPITCPRAVSFRCIRIWDPGRDGEGGGDPRDRARSRSPRHLRRLHNAAIRSSTTDRQSLGQVERKSQILFLCFPFFPIMCYFCETRYDT